MANSKAKEIDETNLEKKETAKTTKKEAAPVYEELNLDEKVTVHSISGWTTGFNRITDGFGGSVMISPGGSARLTRNEIIAQVQNGNKLFNGTDGKGSHATYFIDDAATRREVGFETDDTKQVVFSEQLVKELFDIKNQTEFEEKFKENILVRAEKYAVFPAIKKLGINDYAKIRFVEEYTGFKMQ